MSRPRPARFDAAWQRRHRIGRWWRSARWFAVLAVLIGAGAWLKAEFAGGEWVMVDLPVTACGQQPSAACMIDGDTLMLDRRRIRLTGYDAPEIDGACAAESTLARRATLAAAQWLDEAPFEMDGGSDPPRDRYGRELRGVRRDDQQLDTYMIEQGFARSNGWDSAPPAWCE